MTNQLSEYQNLRQHTLTRAQKMKLLLRTVRAVRHFYNGDSLQSLDAQVENRCYKETIIEIICHGINTTSGTAYAVGYAVA
jgi:hypothetical protein